MKKKILLIAMLALLLMPLTTFAEEKKEYNSMNLKETLEAEDIELKNENYKETDDQITIYMFRGSGCTYCKAFLEYLNGISKEYGKYFKLESYDIWTDTKNQELFEEVVDYLDQNIGGVPLIIIGDDVFPGYDKSYNDGIEASIKALYAEKDRYDIFEEMEKAKEEERKKEFLQSAPFAITINGVITVLSAVAVILFINCKAKKLNKKVEELEKKLMANNNKKEEKEHKERHEEKNHKDKKSKNNK